MSSTKTKVFHDVKVEWTHLCFFLAECICGKTLFAADKQDLYKKWEEHTS